VYAVLTANGAAGVNVNTLLDCARIVPLTAGLIAKAARTALTETGRSNRMTIGDVRRMRLPVGCTAAMRAFVGVRTVTAGFAAVGLERGVGVASGTAAVTGAGRAPPDVAVAVFCPLTAAGGGVLDALVVLAVPPGSVSTACNSLAEMGRGVDGGVEVAAGGMTSPIPTTPTSSTDVTTARYRRAPGTVISVAM